MTCYDGDDGDNHTVTLAFKRQQPARATGALRAPFVPLSTPRLLLVALALEHAPSVFAYASNPEVSHTFHMPRHKSPWDSRRLVGRAMIGYAEGGHYEWALIRRMDQAFIGTCGLGQLDVDHRLGDINYVLAKPYWGQGYATEAAEAVLQFTFNQLKLRCIQAYAFPENGASLRVLTKLGLR